MENAENIQTEQVAPAPVTPTTPTVVETKPNEAVKPADANAEAVKKQNAAFAAMRKEAREAKIALAAATAKASSPVAPVVEGQPKVENTIVPTAPVQPITENGIEVESAKAIEALGMDAKLSTIPGGVLDIVTMVDTDPRLNRLHNIDPTLAFREAKEIYLSKMGISEAPAVPKPSTPSGGMSVDATSLEGLVAACEKATPGTKEYNTLANKIKEAMGKLEKL